MRPILPKIIKDDDGNPDFEKSINQAHREMSDLKKLFRRKKVKKTKEQILSRNKGKMARKSRKKNRR